MAKSPFTVEDGIVPGRKDLDLGSSTQKFGNLNLDSDINVDGNINVAANKTVSVGGSNLLDESTAIALSIALG